ncbi:hypothetical protein [Lentzea sp. CC55]|uniref:MmyB family transcriptional regulator n=1 Tax=Lentzea sp. CC55 TaxID=2884909 RepID=UPI0035B084EA
MPSGLHRKPGSSTRRSAGFASMWAGHRVQVCATAVCGMRHPVVGPLAVAQQIPGNGTGPNAVVATLCQSALPGRRQPRCHYYFSVDQNQTSSEGRPRHHPPVTALPRRRTPADVRWTPAGARRR